MAGCHNRVLEFSFASENHFCFCFFHCSFCPQVPYLVLKGVRKKNHGSEAIIRTFFMQIYKLGASLEVDTHDITPYQLVNFFSQQISCQSFLFQILSITFLFLFYTCVEVLTP